MPSWKIVFLLFPICQEAVDSIPGQVIPKTIKTVLATLSFALSIEKVELVGLVSV